MFSDMVSKITRPQPTRLSSVGVHQKQEISCFTVLCMLQDAQVTLKFLIASHNQE